MSTSTGPGPSRIPGPNRSGDPSKCRCGSPPTAFKRNPVASIPARCLLCAAIDRYQIEAQGQRDLPVPEHIRHTPAALIHPHDTVWNHQALAIEELNLGRNVVVATPTASGKTLVFHLHTFAMLHHDPQAATLVLYPAKALANDQLLRWKHAATTAALSPDCIKQITGDVPVRQRQQLLAAGSVVIMTPGVVHAWLLRSAHTAPVAAFLRRRRLAITDEAHVYEDVLTPRNANHSRAPSPYQPAKPPLQPATKRPKPSPLSPTRHEKHAIMSTSTGPGPSGLPGPNRSGDPSKCRCGSPPTAFKRNPVASIPARCLLCAAIDRYQIQAQGQRDLPVPEHIRRTPAALIHPHDTVWKHQALAIEELNLDRNVVVATPTASGKTLVFHLHTLFMLHHDPHAATLVLPGQGTRQRPAPALEAGRRHHRTSPRLHQTDHRRRPVRQRQQLLATGSVVIMTPGVVHAWLLRSAHTGPVAAFLRRLRLVITDQAHV